MNTMRLTAWVLAAAARFSTVTSDEASAAALLGDVGYTTTGGTDAYTGQTFSSGENIYGPFEAGFNGAVSMQAAVIQELGCSSEDAANVYVLGGIDTSTAEQMVAFQCGVTLPRTAGSVYYGLVDKCGGHTAQYHFHERFA